MGEEGARLEQLGSTHQRKHGIVTGCGQEWPWTLTLQPPPPKCGDYRGLPPCPVYVALGTEPRVSCVLGKDYILSYMNCILFCFSEWTWKTESLKLHNKEKKRREKKTNNNENLLHSAPHCREPHPYPGTIIVHRPGWDSARGSLTEWDFSI